LNGHFETMMMMMMMMLMIDDMMVAIGSSSFGLTHYILF